MHLHTEDKSSSFSAFLEYFTVKEGNSYALWLGIVLWIFEQFSLLFLIVTDDTVANTVFVLSLMIFGGFVFDGDCIV